MSHQALQSSQQRPGQQRPGQQRPGQQRPGQQRPDQQRTDQGPNIVAGFRLIFGAVLVAIGVCLGLYLVSVVLGLIQSDKPIPLMTTVFLPAVEQVDAQAEAVKQPIDLSMDLKRMIVMGVAACLFLFPTLIATSMIAGGVSLMKGGADEAIQKLAVKLRASP